MSTPFTSFEVQPFYGAYRAAVEFTVEEGLTGDVYIYRSPNGVNGWVLLNPDDPVDAATGLFVDADVDSTFTGKEHYRGLLDDGGPSSGWRAGDPVAPFQRLLARQRTGARAILRREYRQLARTKGNGTPAFLFIPKEAGEHTPGFDEETGQQLGVDCPSAGENDGFGTEFKGGYHTPIPTWIRMLGAQAESSASTSDATRDDDKADMVFRLLAQPRPRKGYLYVFPMSDARYVVADPMTPFYFPGTDFPIAWEVPVERLDPSDPRCRLECPEWPEDLTHPYD